MKQVCQFVFKQVVLILEYYNRVLYSHRFLFHPFLNSASSLLFTLSSHFLAWEDQNYLAYLDFISSVMMSCEQNYAFHG